MKNDTIYVLDSYGLIYRSYYAFISRPLVNEKGENVSAIYGFFSNFLSLLLTDSLISLFTLFITLDILKLHILYTNGHFVFIKLWVIHINSVC